MPKKNSRKNSHLNTIGTKASASTDCTGLIPSEPKSEAEKEAYRELYNTEPVERP